MYHTRTVTIRHCRDIIPTKLVERIHTKKLFYNVFTSNMSEYDMHFTLNHFRPPQYFMTGAPYIAEPHTSFRNRYCSK